MKKLTKILSVLIVIALMVSIVPAAFAMDYTNVGDIDTYVGDMSTTEVNELAEEASDPTGFGVKDMSYGMAVVAIPLMNKVFDVCNLVVVGSNTWTSEDGELYEDLTYGDASRECQKYDLYIPNGLDKSKAQGVLLFIHGGTWTMGDKSCMSYLCTKFAKYGYIAATMNYDLASQGNDDVAKVTGSKSNADIFDMLDDVNDCIKSIKDKCNDLGYTVNSLALSGQSAGSHISALYAYSRPQDSAIPIKMVFNLTTPVGFYDGVFDNYTAAEVAQYASIVSGENLTESDITSPDSEAQAILDSISPMHYVNKNTVPSLMGFAGKDTTIGTNQYQSIKPLLDKYGVDNDVVWWENSDHTLMFDPGTIDTWTEKSVEWLGKYMGTSSSVSSSLPFTDVSSSMWYCKYIENVYSKGYMSGTTATTFSPDKNTTRGQVLAVLYKAQGCPDVSGLSCPLKDVKSAWCKDAIIWGYNQGIISGYENGTSGYDDTVTREQLAAFLYKYSLKYDTNSDKGKLNTLTRYNDSSAVSECFATAVKWAVGNGILSGFEDNTLRPQVPATRAQFAAMITALIK